MLVSPKGELSAAFLLGKGHLKDNGQICIEIIKELPDGKPTAPEVFLFRFVIKKCKAEYSKGEGDLGKREVIPLRNPLGSGS